MVAVICSRRFRARCTSKMVPGNPNEAGACVSVDGVAGETFAADELSPVASWFSDFSKLFEEEFCKHTGVIPQITGRCCGQMVSLTFPFTASTG